MDNKTALSKGYVIFPEESETTEFDAFEASQMDLQNNQVEPAELLGGRDVTTSERRELKKLDQEAFDEADGVIDY